MTTRIAITHRIERSFAHSVRLPTHWLRVRPAPQTRARITAYSIALAPEPHFINWLRDPFENYIARLDLPEPLPRLDIATELLAELEPVNPFDFLLEPDVINHPFDYTPQLCKELAPYLALGELSPHVSDFLQSLERTPVSTLERLSVTAQKLLAAFPAAALRHTQAAPALDGLLARGEGSCWDLAWLLTLSLRQLGLASRFTCGYRVQLADNPKLDSVNLHTWTETFVPGAGWLGLDPCTGLFTNEMYIPLACGPDPARVQPVIGEAPGCAETRVESLQLRRLTPAQLDWPYSSTQWADISALGELVQRDLAAKGASLGTGMTLAFVATGAVGAPEWQTQALGPSKRLTAESLLVRLLQRSATGGLPQCGQGDWFAGEALPRWRLLGLFRSDGLPVWRNPVRQGFDRTPAGASEAAANALACGIARGLGIAPSSVVPAYEDPLHALWRWPASGTAPTAEELDDPRCRRELAARLSAPGGPAVGYVLPLGWDHVAGAFRSGPWSFRRTGLHLMPGDSPMGYRLPLDSLPEDKQAVLDGQLERSPFEERAALPDFHALIEARVRASASPPSAAATNAMDAMDAMDRTGTRAASPPRTAVCVQAREGALYVFMPPLSHAEHYLELVAAVELAAESAGVSVTLEGYDPPEDHRLRRFVLEPDAGVLRVELPETHAFQAELDLLRATYEEAHWVGLGTQRVTPEGTLVSSGGGGRLSIGGARPIDSPLLRRPQLLRGLVAYFQRHPSLSYLFAGRMIGPSGPAPRPDEGREETLYELAIALANLPDGETWRLWTGDRSLRHLLTDPAGQIRHAEIRMDQLYAPERASRRMGRVLIHAFELGPHLRVAALQSLLVQALIGRFASLPDTGELTRWGSALHDRFMLPQVLWEDLRNVVGDLQAAGYPFQLEWFEPILALRFPVLGSVPIGGITLELQTALEPWPLLAEEVAGGGVARFIDAANERLQARLTGLAPGRYVLACNGKSVPLQFTGQHGECVAGVRYKVANPPSTLHPTIPPVDALVFDLIDTWTGRAVGGCTYLPPRPQLWGAVGVPLFDTGSSLGAGGPGEEALERTQRSAPLPHASLVPPGRPGRFLPYGSGIGPMAAPPLRSDPHFPFLLDFAHHE